jgi:cyclopropane-fatty-acyl-phospholipid synthase
VALIHSIMTSKSASLTDPFTQKYIFPGGYVPGASEALRAVERAGLWPLDFEVWRKHYGFTLRHWYERFMANRAAAKAMYDERFCRMWEIYLLGFESSFLTGNLAVMQLQLGRQRDAVPLSRDYMAQETQSLAARETAPAPAGG